MCLIAYTSFYESPGADLRVLERWMEVFLTCFTTFSTKYFFYKCLLSGLCEDGLTGGNLRHIGNIKE